MENSSLINNGGTRMSYGDGKAVREPSTGKGRFDLVTPFGWMRLAKWYELGAHKYSDRNWEKGMPFSRYIDSALRHIVKWIMGMTDEDHLSAAVWNLLCIIHHEELGQTELDDMPHYFNKKDTLESNDLINQMRRLHEYGQSLPAAAYILGIDDITARKLNREAGIGYEE